MTDYPIDMQLLVDPLNPENVVRSGAVYLYDPSDEAGVSPIALKDPSGLPLPNPLTSNAYGFTSPFITTIPKVKWKSGNFEGFFYSYDGLRNEAIAARAAAEEAASAAGAQAVADVAARVAAGEFKGAPGQDGSNVLPTDTAIRDAINNGASATRGALNNTIATATAPKLDATAAASTYTPRAAPALAGAAFIAYGHSHVAGNGASATAKRWVNQFAALSGTTLTNRGTGGNSMPQTLHKISGGSVQWVPGTKALVGLQSVLNDVLHTTDADFANDALGFAAALRTALRILRSSAYIPPTDPSIVYGGTWDAPVLTGGRGSGGTAKRTSTIGDTITIPNPGTGEITILAYTGYTVTGPRTFDVKVGGTVYGGTQDTSRAVGCSSAGVNPDGYQVNAYHVTGLPLTGDILVTALTAPAGVNSKLFFNGYLLPPVTPPSIFVVKDSHTSNYRTTGITSAIGQYRLDVLNKHIDTIVAEPEFGGRDQTRTVDAGVGFNWDTMVVPTDEIHRNDAGHLAQAVTTLEQLKTMPLRYGMRG